MLTPVFAQLSPHRSRESVAVVRRVPIQIGPPSSSEGRERTVFSCLRDRCVGAVCAHYVCHTIWRKLRVFHDFLRIFRRKSPTFCSSCPFSAGFPLATDTPCVDGGKVQPITAATCAERAGRRPVWRVRSEGVTNGSRSVGLLPSEPGGASGGCRRPAARRWNGLGAVRRANVRSVAPVHKKAGRRKVDVCRREEVQCSAVRNRASRGARLITPSRVCGFSACH